MQRTTGQRAGRRSGVGAWGLVWVLGVCVGGVGEAKADGPVPASHGHEAAVAWLERAGREARRITGVGDALTVALQTKGELLAAVAAWQAELGLDEAAAANDRLVGLCVRALAHDGEAGWVRAGRAWAAARVGNADGARAALAEVKDREERAWAAYLLGDWGVLTTENTDPTTLPLDAVSSGFALQLERRARHREVYDRAKGLSGAAAESLVEGLGSPRERAWASLGVARGLFELERLAEAPTEAEAPTGLPEPDPGHAGVSATSTEEPTAIVVIEPSVSVEPTEPQSKNGGDATVAVATHGGGLAEPPTAVGAEPLPVEAPAAAEVAAAEQPAASVPPAVEGDPGSEAESVVEPATPLAEARDVESVPTAEVAEESQAQTKASSEAIPEVDSTVIGTTQVVDADGFDPATDPVVVAEPERQAVADPVALPAFVPAPDVADDAEAFTEDVEPRPLPIVPNLKRLAQPDEVLDSEPAPAAFEARFVTTAGAFTLRVHRDWAPLAADRFHDLCRSGYYHNQRFFRVVPGFVVQWGIHGFPTVAEPWRAARLPDEPRARPNRRGTVAFAAAATPGTRTTQVFVNLADQPYLDELGFVPFGEVVEGMDVVESLFADYGETPSTRQREIQLGGNAFLDREFPELDSVIAVEVRETTGR
ncbi:MAG: peptidylprolyl isomerase [Planctomycetota bacterium]